MIIFARSTNSSKNKKRIALKGMLKINIFDSSQIKIIMLKTIFNLFSLLETCNFPLHLSMK